MRSSIVIMAVAGMAVQPAVATFDWLHQQPYKAVGYGTSQCNNQQSSGWNWGDLNVGSVSSYGGFNFKGWNCQSKFGVLKRDEEKKRGFLDGLLSSGGDTSSVFGVSKPYVTKPSREDSSNHQ